MVGELIMQLEELQYYAEEHLEKAVELGDIKQAWEVFKGLTPLLPKNEWLPDSGTYPLFRAFLDKSCYTERYQQLAFSELMDDAVHYFFDEEETEDYAGFSKEQIEAVMWEVMRNGDGKFTYDW